VRASTLHDEWVLRVEGLGVEPQRLVDAVMDRVERTQALTVSRSEMIATDAVIALADKQSTWRPAEIVREVAALTPTNLAISAVEVVTQIDDLAARIESARCVDLSAPVRAGVRLRRDGHPVTEASSHRALTTATILAEETEILEWAERAQRGDGVDEPAVLEYATVELSVGQAQCAAAVAGTKELVLVVGPAGTGKTTALAPAVAYLNEMQVPVFAVAPSAVAAWVRAAARWDSAG
jgi:flagellar biosynthesis GTPase FlhF